MALMDVIEWTDETGEQMIQRFPASGVSQFAIRPQTGRTHQIRVHLASAGMPLVGDAVYGRSRARHWVPAGIKLDRPALHAAVLGFIHPTLDQSLRFEVPLPADLARLLAALETHRLWSRRPRTPTTG